jgi:hypothetical protein
MIACIPFVEKIIVAINIKRRSPLLLWVTMSIIVVWRKLKAFDGRIFSKSFISSCWKLGIGINGIRVKRKIEAGSNAIRRLNAIDEARVTKNPFRKPLITKVITWLIGTPSKPGRTSFFIFSFSLKTVTSLRLIIYMALRLISRLFT